MSKYSFDRLGAERFETLVQALFESRFRVAGNLVHFGDGPDGAREATWTQPSDHQDYSRPANEDSDVPKEWVFQVKFHDIGTRGWAGARAAVEGDLNDELEKVVIKYKLKCHKYILITNIPFSGVRNVGTRDRVTEVANKWKDKIPEIEVWDAVDLSRMLDADPDTRTSYLDDVLPGDVLRGLLQNVSFVHDRRNSAFSSYLTGSLRAEKDAKAEEAGDEGSLPLEAVYVDLDMRLSRKCQNEKDNIEFIACLGEKSSSRESIRTRASFGLLAASHPNILLRGGPGVGKSTITQFLALFHAARLQDKPLSKRLLGRLKPTGEMSPDELDAFAELRFPFRIELRRYAQWLQQPERNGIIYLSEYLAERVRESAGEGAVTANDVFWLIGENPTVLILDGLDEVPNQHARDSIFRELQVFLDRCKAEGSDLQLVLSTRPQGYRGEFSGFDPIEWDILDLTRDQFNGYATDWMNTRVLIPDERKDASERINAAMESKAVSQLATTLLQATVMLTIVKQKLPIPHARHQLFKQYVDVIFNREETKQTVRQHKEALRRLHDLVGFKLILKMESGDAIGTLGGDEFRTCVQQTIQDYGQNDIESTVGETVDTIVSQAKDRLCLLAGKGKDQEEVDFVLQSFREFFAAQYLSEHELADPHAVYAALAQRRTTWENVLQFYAAFQTRALQLGWIIETDGESLSQNTVATILHKTHLRRTLISVLPEFARPKNDVLVRAVRNVCAFDTRWTWDTPEKVAAQFSAFCSEACSAMRSECEGLSKDDAQSAEFELAISAASCTDVEDEQRFLSSALSHKELIQAVLKIANSRGCLIDLSNVDLEELVKFSLSQGPRGAKLLDSYSQSQLLACAVSDFGGMLHFSSERFAEGLLYEIIQYLTPARISLRDEMFLAPSAYVVRRDKSKATALLEEAESLGSGPLLAWCRTLLNSIINEDIASYKLVEVEEQNIAIGTRYAAAEQLGPSPLPEESLGDWTGRIEQARLAFELAEKHWFPHVRKHSFSILTFLFCPAAWKHLAGICEDEEFELLTKTCSEPAQVIWDSARFSLHGSFDGEFPCPIELFESVLSAVEELGADAVRMSFFWAFALSKSSIDNSEQLRGLLTRTIKCKEDIPSEVVPFILSCYAYSEPEDLTPLFDCWRRYRDSIQFWMVDSPETDRVALRVLHECDDWGPELASNLLPDQQFSGVEFESASNEISRALVSLILKNETERLESQVVALCRQLPVPEELEVWSNIELCSQILDLSNVGSIGNRIRKLTTTVRHDDRQKCWEYLETMVENRKKYDRATAIAVVDLMLRLDELALAPLEDADWQIC